MTDDRPDGAGAASNGVRKAWESRDGQFGLYSDETRGIWRMAGLAAPRSDSLISLTRRPGGGEWVPAERGLFFRTIGGSRQATFDLFDFNTRRITSVFTLPGPYDGGSGFTVSPDGTWLVYAQRDLARSEIMVMDVDC